MNVRSVAPNGVEQHLVHELDDGGIVGPAGGGISGTVLADIHAILELQLADGIVHPIERGQHVAIVMGQVRLQHRHELVHRAQHRIDAQAGSELQLIEFRQGRGVGHRHRQPMAAAGKRHHTQLAQQLFRVLTGGGQAGQAQRIQVDHRQAVLPGRTQRSLARGGQARLDHML